MYLLSLLEVKGKCPSRSVLTRPLRLVVFAERSMMPKGTWCACVNSSCVCGGSKIGTKLSSVPFVRSFSLLYLVIDLAMGLVFDRTAFICPIVASFDFGK